MFPQTMLPGDGLADGTVCASEEFWKVVEKQIIAQKSIGKLWMLIRLLIFVQFTPNLHRKK